MRSVAGVRADRFDFKVYSSIAANSGNKSASFASPRLQSSLSLWAPKLDSELLFVGDAGETEPSRASKRMGIEWNNHYVATKWLLLDADLAVSRARFTAPEPADPTLGNRIPGSIQTVAAFGATVTERGPWFGQFQLRCFGPRALDENNAQRSKATTLACLRGGYRINPNLKLLLDVFNLFNRHGSGIDYYHASGLKASRPALSRTSISTRRSRAACGCR